MNGKDVSAYQGWKQILASSNVAITWKRYPANEETKQKQTPVHRKASLDQIRQPQSFQQSPITPLKNRSEKRNTNKNQINKQSFRAKTQTDGILQNNNTSKPVTEKNLWVKTSLTDSKGPRAMLSGW
jgi:CRISPR/Cas system CMR-associated protein Cmr5 small subunit